MQSATTWPRCRAHSSLVIRMHFDLASRFQLQSRRQQSICWPSSNAVATGTVNTTTAAIIIKISFLTITSSVPRAVRLRLKSGVNRSCQHIPRSRSGTRNSNTSESSTFPSRLNHLIDSGRKIHMRGAGFSGKIPRQPVASRMTVTFLPTDGTDRRE
jgi:hypothetical protein